MLIWPFDLLFRRAAQNSANPRERAAVAQIRQMLSPVADEPLHPSTAPMGQRAMQDLLLKCARRHPAGSPERSELCALFIETARFQPLAEQASREMEAMFTTGGNLSPRGLLDATAELRKAEEQVMTGRAILRRRLEALGPVEEAGGA